MKSIVIYYSQTGNTKKIAQAIHKGIAQRVKQCDIARLKEVQPEELANYDLIGLGSPVWGGQPTANMQVFINSLPSSLEGKHCFYFCTHGTLPAQVILVAVQALRQKGLIVVGWENWYGSVSLPGHYKPYFTDGHPDEIDLEEAEVFGSEMAERSLGISQGATDLIPKLPEGSDYVEIYGERLDAPLSNIDSNKPKIHNQFPSELNINAEKCASCMLCADNCPINNIDSSVSPPVFKSTLCCGCYYCEGICPAGAIECDFEKRRMEGNTKHLNQNALDEAEKKGRFRRLVPLADIGWDTPWEKVSDHPRLKVL